MVDNLVSNAAVVLQDIEIFCATCFGNLLGHGQEFLEVFVRDIGELCTVELGNHERMATAERLDIKESKNLVALEELERRDITYFSQRSLAPIKQECLQRHRKPFL